MEVAIQTLPAECLSWRVVWLQYSSPRLAGGKHVLHGGRCHFAGREQPQNRDEGPNHPPLKSAQQWRNVRQWSWWIDLSPCVLCQFKKKKKQKTSNLVPWVISILYTLWFLPKFHSGGSFPGISSSSTHPISASPALAEGSWRGAAGYRLFGEAQSVASVTYDPELSHCLKQQLIRLGWGNPTNRHLWIGHPWEGRAITGASIIPTTPARSRAAGGRGQEVILQVVVRLGFRLQHGQAGPWVEGTWCVAHMGITKEHRPGYGSQAKRGDHPWAISSHRERPGLQWAPASGRRDVLWAW